ncbi:hypothetical protein DEO72_LG7g376 [Vigna unguiculata]|uniref:Mediator complex subunit 15 KIX domain-containing protein n=1 Tax=Vigna unguiculata TaxID=3917 RepID=A0A4D6MGG2_VIGUN|nr:hypothetical protein DEO72_LG7g376 [Vigna unguiculata]
MGDAEGLYMLQRCYPILGLEGLYGHWNLAKRFEEMIFTTVTSQSNYLWKISTNLLVVESRAYDRANP